MKIDKIPADAIKIKNSTDYVDRNGNIYSEDKRSGHSGFILREQQTIYGYKYCNIRYINEGKYINITKRVHRVVAEAFIENPNNYPIVMHLDNNKSNNKVENLRWGTISENTKSAFNDGLITNKSGFDDSQSIACRMYSTLTNELLKEFGSIHIAAKQTNISVKAISNQIKNIGDSIRKPVYFTSIESGPKRHYIVVEYDYISDIELHRYVNCGKASIETGIAQNTIAEQVSKNTKPKFITKSKTYFLRKEI